MKYYVLKCFMCYSFLAMFQSAFSTGSICLFSLGELDLLNNIMDLIAPGTLFFSLHVRLYSNVESYLVKNVFSR